MQTPLPTNDEIIAYSDSVPWKGIEQAKRRFNERLKELLKTAQDDSLPLDDLSQAAGIPVTLLYEDASKGNVLLGHLGDRPFVLGSFVSQRYRFGKPLLKAIIPYNFNPAVNHHNLHETENPTTDLRALGAELELGLYRPDGSAPTEDEIQRFSEIYRNNARKLGITPQVDREACQYQVEVHVAPGVGYHRTRQSLDGILQSLVLAGDATGLNTAVMAAYPILSDFHLTDDPKVHTAVDVMVEINNRFPEYLERQAQTRARYHIKPEANVVEIFRNQGCHIHLDIAGRSEALGLFTFYTMLRSATAIANATVLKGSPFVNGTCDAELLCTREFLRGVTVTARYIEMPLSPHLLPEGLARYGHLLYSERANAAARAMLCDGSLGEDISAMHNPIGRIRPDLGMSKRICTMESTGMPVNISASRQAAVLTDFEFTHVLLENYYRKYGTNLEPMYADKTLWEIAGPLSTEKFIALQEHSDRAGTDMVLETAGGRSLSLVDFYEMKRRYMHRHLIDMATVTPRDIDDVYASLSRMLEPPSGRVAETPEQYIIDATTRSTGNWGRILRNAFIEEGGTPGDHNPDAVLRVVNRVHNALRRRYQEGFTTGD
ncbi:MAG: hypothetical protein MUE40_03765 [Anaerolineae bacterium]|nr:hypothetical protein [Anaerolineae bacterium]